MMDTDPHETSKVEFHIEEYKSLRAETLALVARYDQLKIVTIGGLGALYAWIFGNVIALRDTLPCDPLQGASVLFVLIIPVWLSFMAGFAGMYMYNTFGRLGAYLRRLEFTLGRSDLGWEKFAFGRKEVNDAKMKRQGILNRRDNFWAIVLISSLVASSSSYLFVSSWPLCE